MGPRDTRGSVWSLLSSVWFCFCELLFTAKSAALPVHGGHRARACVASCSMSRAPSYGQWLSIFKGLIWHFTPRKKPKPLEPCSNLLYSTV